MAMANSLLSPGAGLGAGSRRVQAGSCRHEHPPLQRRASGSCSLLLSLSLMEKVAIVIVQGVASRISVFRLFIEIH